MRLIDAKALRTCFTEIPFDSLSSDELSIVLKFYDAIGNAPTIDAEPVVRCKDCVYYRPEPYGNVMMCYEFANGYWPHPDDYCSRGEKMDLEVQDD